jgi:hypothetical protein
MEKLGTKETNMETNHTEWHSERLQRRLDELNEIDQPWQGSAERMAQIALEKDIIGFELAMRYAEEKEIQIEEAWHERV